MSTSINNSYYLGLVLQTFGVGNATTKEDFTITLKEAVSRGVVIVIITQCLTGTVDLSLYETGEHLSSVSF